MLSRFLASLLIIPLALISGCGGGGDSTNSTSSSNSGSSQLTIPGLWTGTYTDSGTYPALFFLNENKEFISLFESQPTFIGDKTFQYGNINSNGNSITGSGLLTSSKQVPLSIENLKYRDPTMMGLNINTKYSKVNGSIVGGNSINLTYSLSDKGIIYSNVISVDNTKYNYNRQSVISDLGSIWVVDASNLNSAFIGYPNSLLKISTDGSFSVDNSNNINNKSMCNFTGKFTPSANGKNYFTVIINTGSANCNKPNSVFSGFAFIFTNNDLKKRIIIGAIDTTKEYSAFIVN